MADPRVTQNPVEVPTSDPGKTVVTQNPVEVVNKTAPPPIRVTQSPVEVVNQLVPPPIDITQFVIEIVGTGLFEDDFVNVCVCA